MSLQVEDENLEDTSNANVEYIKIVQIGKEQFADLIEKFHLDPHEATTAVNPTEIDAENVNEISTTKDDNLNGIEAGPSSDNYYLFEIKSSTGKLSWFTITAEKLNTFGLMLMDLDENNNNLLDSEGNTMLGSTEDSGVSCGAHKIANLSSGEVARASFVNSNDTEESTIKKPLRRRARCNNEHIISLEDSHSFQCLKCSEIFSMEYLKKYHAYCNTANGVSPFACQHCSRRFLSKSHLSSHERAVHNNLEVSFKCNTCGQQFCYKPQLQRHINKNHTRTIVTYCSANDQADQGNDSFSKMHNCMHCGKLFTRNFNCKRHLSTHLNEERNPFRCRWCNRRFSTEADMIVHKADHIKKDREYKCNICQSSFSRSSYLRRHELIHSNQRGCYQCSFCDIIVKRRDNLKRHLQVTHRLSGNSWKTWYQTSMEVTNTSS